MVDFNFHLSTEIHFGKGIVRELPETIKKYGNKIFFLYDEIPAKTTGAYDLIHSLCKENGIEIAEFTGIEPNPRHTTVDKAVSLCKEAGSQMIVALGGGSTIDSAKAMSFAVFHDGMLIYGKEASNRKQEIDRQHHTIPNKRNKTPKDKQCGKIQKF